MKLSIWDILTGLTLLAILCLVGVFGAILYNPAVAFNPLRPPAAVATIALPTATETQPGLPPTWTPIPRVEEQQPAEQGMPTLRPSSTPQPTATRVILPTFTPSKTARIGIPGQGGGNCSVIFQDPKDDSYVDAGKPFDMRWTLKNTGDTTWNRSSVDLRFMSGERMHGSTDLRDLNYDVGAGGAVDILIDMTAPKESGEYTSNWALLEGSKTICRFFVTVKVR